MVRHVYDAICKREKLTLRNLLDLHEYEADRLKKLLIGQLTRKRERVIIFIPGTDYDHPASQREGNIGECCHFCLLRSWVAWYVTIVKTPKYDWTLDA